MSFRLWWHWNDGMSGHVWLSSEDAKRLAAEMSIQGCGGLADRILAVEDEATIKPQDITEALASISPQPLGPVDATLWEDWVRFLEGAEAKGGLLVHR